MSKIKKLPDKPQKKGFLMAVRQTKQPLQQFLTNQHLMKRQYTEELFLDKLSMIISN